MSLLDRATDNIRAADGNTYAIARLGDRSVYYGVLRGGICVEMVRGKKAALAMHAKLVADAGGPMHAPK